MLLLSCFDIFTIIFIGLASDINRILVKKGKFLIQCLSVLHIITHTQSSKFCFFLNKLIFSNNALN